MRGLNSVGIMQYSALVPCAFASLTASMFAHYFGVHADAFGTVKIVEFGLVPAEKILILGILCALLSVVFCLLLHTSHHLFKNTLKTLICVSQSPAL